MSTGGKTTTYIRSEMGFKKSSTIYPLSLAYTCLWRTNAKKVEDLSYLAIFLYQKALGLYWTNKFIQENNKFPKKF